MTQISNEETKVLINAGYLVVILVGTTAGLALARELISVIRLGIQVIARNRTWVRRRRITRKRDRE